MDNVRLRRERLCKQTQFVVFVLFLSQKTTTVTITSRACIHCDKMETTLGRKGEDDNDAPPPSLPSPPCRVQLSTLHRLSMTIFKHHPFVAFPGFDQHRDLQPCYWLGKLERILDSPHHNREFEFCIYVMIQQSVIFLKRTGAIISTASPKFKAMNKLLSECLPFTMVPSLVVSDKIPKHLSGVDFAGVPDSEEDKIELHDLLFTYRTV